MENVQIEIVNGVFHLLDDKGAIVFFDEDWNEVQDFAYGDYNIQYQPKDLIFDVGLNDDYGSFVYFNVKYGSNDNILGSHNVINLPGFINSEELMKGHFGYDKKMAKENVIEALVALGATYKQIIG